MNIVILKLFSLKMQCYEFNSKKKVTIKGQSHSFLYPLTDWHCLLVAPLLHMNSVVVSYHLGDINKILLQ